MADNTSCPICIEKYTTVVRTKICCNFCTYHSCKGCVQKYLLSQATDAHCMSCRTGWNREFIDTNLTKTFRTGPWRDHIKTILVNREKATLPTYQRYASALKHMSIYRTKVADIYLINTSISSEMSKCRARMHLYITKYSREETNEEDKINIRLEYEIVAGEYTVLNKKYMCSEFDRLYMNTCLLRQENIYYNRAGPEERKEFIMKCVKDDCRGFLSSSYKCELCSCYVCKDCMLVKKEKNDDSHICKDSDKESVALIRKETKPCPKCGIRISKIDGCDQMWCTASNCGTAFSWNSGKVISGTIHNPHYYDWIRRNNNGVVPRNPGEVLCGGLPEYRALSRLMLNTLRIPIVHSNVIFDIHRCINDIEDARIPVHPQVRDGDMFKELHCEFLLNRITDDDWKQSIFLKENKFEKKQQIGQVLQTFVAAGTEVMRSLYTEMLAMDTLDLKKITNRIDEFNNLRNYINNSLETVGKNMMCAVPQIGPEWYYIVAKNLIKARADEEKTLAKIKANEDEIKRLQAVINDANNQDEIKRLQALINDANIVEDL